MADPAVTDALALAGPVPAGVAGECENCGEHMPRLVDGQCGYCRDGRIPPARDVEPTMDIEERVMATVKQVSIRASGANDREVAASAALEGGCDAGLDASAESPTKEASVESSQRLRRCTE